ncbi:hypothetical protein ACH5RR_041120 [Cinchona calisaya]|uniref:Uncharacterized protein n=1 Tax=Cinchona calisaya TaxID=153742 RepID=A0ABD2XTK6_9GENT
MEGNKDIKDVYILMEELYKEEQEWVNEYYGVRLPTTIGTNSCLERKSNQFWEKCLVAMNYVKERDMRRIGASVENKFPQKSEVDCELLGSREILQVLCPRFRRHGHIVHQYYQKSHAYFVVTDGLIILDHEDLSHASGFHSHHHILLMINLLVLYQKNLESVAF